jgi:hypothetical protein
VIDTWLRMFPALATRKNPDGSHKLTGRYSRYDGHRNLITGKPHSRAREAARRMKRCP